MVKDSWLPLQAAWVQPLVGELRSHMLHGAAKFFFLIKKKKKTELEMQRAKNR